MPSINVLKDVWCRIIGHLRLRHLWEFIFKHKEWLDLAKKHDRALPLLLGSHLSTFRPGEKKSRYWVLIITDYFGDLRYDSGKFFKSLQDGWNHRNKYELYHESGITLNIRDVIAPDEVLHLPLENMFSEKEGELYCEYSFYHDPGITAMTRDNIIGLEGATREREHTKNGCTLRLEYKKKSRQYLIEPDNQKQQIWGNQWDERGLITSITTKAPTHRTTRSPFPNYVKD
ncbi:hypothetical protein F9C07_2099040 [Aspergillus flavus]|uniref:Uncharacterized protein n=1 Tax=Aspergillus flavus (strain ATCC 200026 / FGSC A1120 / IAM 13836 / NRRL 3357 / JCM 12722 / SRRC 167) TaxID=332952 RepID=A0A7U2QR99_ASPFN|nr:hypothetical protein F9C07_2099040 [Aspergillus flavus]